MDNLLSIKNLKVYFYLEEGIARIIDGVSLEIGKGEMLGLVGESGCGKTMLALSILNLIPPPGKIMDGEIIFKGMDLRNLKDEEWQKIRGKEMVIVFQEPLTAFNPLLTIGFQIVESLSLHLSMNKNEAKARAIELLKDLGLREPEIVFESYPHQLSGGMRQRAMLAMSLACNPEFIILDEPTTALDTPLQAQILELLFRIKNEERLAGILISHDLAIVEKIVDTIAIMYLGKILELADKKELFENPKHPYTNGLLDCFPEGKKPKTILKSIKGYVPEALNRPEGCPFHPRCEFRVELCEKKFPEEKRITERHKVWCYNPI